MIQIDVYPTDNDRRLIGKFTTAEPIFPKSPRATVFAVTPAGDVLAEVETDEALIDIEAVEEGVIAKLLVPAGAAAGKVNTPIAILDQGAGAGGGVRRDTPGPRLATGDAGQKLGSVPVEPTVIVRTRFKGTKLSTGQSTAGGPSTAGGRD